MCKSVKDYMGVVREYTREVITFGGFALALLVYSDFKSMVRDLAESNARTAEILRDIDVRLSHLEEIQRKEDK